MLRSSQSNAITTPFMALATIVLLLRLYTRLAMLKNAGTEDVFVILAWIFACVLYTLLAYETSTTILDKHYLEIVATMSAGEISAWLKRFFVSIFFYNFSLACSKLSIAVQYQRIFTGGKTNMAVWGTIIFIVANTIQSFFINLFFCTPVRKSWQPDVQGSCLNKKRVWFTYAGANILASFLLILIPIPAIMKLQMQWRTKVALLCIFSLGGVDILMACLRLSSLSNLAQTTDISWELQPLGVWSFLEAAIAIICASLPALRPLISKAFPNFFSTLSNQSYALPSREYRNPRGEFSRHRGSTEFARITTPGHIIKDVTFDVERSEPATQTSGQESSGRSSEKDVTLVETFGPLDGESQEELRRASEEGRTFYKPNGH